MAASLVADLGTAVGVAPVFPVRRLGVATEVVLLSLAAGVMLAAAR